MQARTALFVRSELTNVATHIMMSMTKSIIMSKTKSEISHAQVSLLQVRLKPPCYLDERETGGEGEGEGEGERGVKRDGERSQTGLK